jgi:DNA polymerase I-like protein with 3'-5' exonuclease and polymerase domains
MAVARVVFAGRWMDSGLEGKLISTVHDRIVLDVPEKNVTPAVQMLHETFRDLPKSISKAFGVNWTLPMICEVGVGHNMKDLTVVEYKGN